MGATKLMTAAGGGITLDAASTATDKTITVPARTGNMAVDGPAFSAYNNSQSFSASTWTKVQCSNEEFDTNSNYDAATNFRFKPTVAGYYQLNGEVSFNTTSTNQICGIYKNGSEFKRGGQLNGASVTVNALVYLNGSTDYVELYGYNANASGLQNLSGAGTYFQGFLARAA